MAGVDDIIGNWVKEAELSGEVRSLPGFGKPFNPDDGFLETPARLRMVHKILKNAGYVPAEIEMLQQLATLRDQLRTEEHAETQEQLMREIAAIEQQVAIKLEGIRNKR